MRQLTISGYARTQIRLRAALCLLKLAQVRAFDRKMTRFLEPISYVMQVGQLDAAVWIQLTAGPMLSSPSPFADQARRAAASSAHVPPMEHDAGDDRD